jgi:hypothetical protein
LRPGRCPECGRASDPSGSRQRIQREAIQGWLRRIAMPASPRQPRTASTGNGRRQTVPLAARQRSAIFPNHEL